MADPCTNLENELDALEQQLTAITSSWGHDIDDVGPGGKAAVVAEHKQETKAIKAKIAAKKAQFETCIKSLPRVPLTISVSGVTCKEETSEGSASEEPYVLVCAVNLKAKMPIKLGAASATIAIPAQRVGLTGPWDDVDAGEHHSASELPAVHRRAFWGINGKAALISNPDDVVFLVGLMENDDASADGVRSAVDAQITGNLFGESTSNRATLVNDLKQAFEDAMAGSRPAGLTFAFNPDDVLGHAQELRITTLDLGWVAHKGTWSRSFDFAGDGGRYRVDIDFKKG